jgi:hypothetical protein
VEVVEPQSVRGELVDVRRLDQAAEAADLREADVVEQENDDVRGAFLRPLLRSPPLLGVRVLLGDDAAEALDFLLLDAVVVVDPVRLRGTGRVGDDAAERRRQQQEEGGEQTDSVHEISLRESCVSR